MTATVSPAPRLAAEPRRPRGPRSRLSAGWLLAAGAAFALTAVLILWALSNADERTDVLVVVSPVASGEAITDADVGTTRLAADEGFGRIYVASQLSSVLGAVAVTDLEPGDLLGPAVLAAAPAATAGERLVGVVLRTGRYPVELKSGDAAWAVNMERDESGVYPSIEVRVAKVTVSDTLEASVTMAVPSDRAAELGAWSGRDQLVLVVSPLGVAG